MLFPSLCKSVSDEAPVTKPCFVWKPVAFLQIKKALKLLLRILRAPYLAEGQGKVGLLMNCLWLWPCLFCTAGASLSTFKKNFLSFSLPSASFHLSNQNFQNWMELYLQLKTQHLTEATLMQ